MEVKEIRIIVSGKPRQEMSNLILALITELRLKNKWTGGITTPEIIKDGESVGFKMIDINTNESKTIARIKGKGKKVGKYHVDIENLNYIVSKFRSHIDTADVIIIDEIGKIELISEEFKRMVEEVFMLDKPIIAVVNVTEVERFRKVGNILKLNKNNSEKVKQNILEKLRL